MSVKELLVALSAALLVLRPWVIEQPITNMSHTIAAAIRRASKTPHANARQCLRARSSLARRWPAARSDRTEPGSIVGPVAYDPNAKTREGLNPLWLAARLNQPGAETLQQGPQE